MVCTYYAISVNNNNQKTKICLIALIKKENKETFSEILNYLKVNFNFSHKIITIDISLAEIMSIRKTFPFCKNLLCFYHIIQRCVKYLPQIRSKNSSIKTKANDLLINIKILLFIDSNNIENYFDMIINKYINDFKKFIKYIYINYFKRFPFYQEY